MTDVLEQIGMTKEELQNRVVCVLVNQIMAQRGIFETKPLATGKLVDIQDEGGPEYDPETGPYAEEPPVRPSVPAQKFSTELAAQCTAMLKAEVAKVADATLQPHAEEIIRTQVLQSTNNWGEKKAEPMTFIEYLVARADKYMQEEVNDKGEVDSDRIIYNRNRPPKQSRLSFMIDEVIKAEIKTAMTDAMKRASGLFAEGLAETLKRKAQIMTESLVVKVSV